MPTAQALGGSALFSNDVHWSSIDDAQPEGLAAKGEADSSLMTQAILAPRPLAPARLATPFAPSASQVERLAVEDAKLTAVEAAGAKVTSASMSFPVTPGAADAIGQFRDGAIGLLVLGIEGETVAVRSSQPAATMDEVVAAAPTDAPSYSLYRWAHEHEGEARAAVVFVYVCPEGSPVRAKMLHASSKSSVLGGLAEAGARTPGISGRG